MHDLCFTNKLNFLNFLRSDILTLICYCHHKSFFYKLDSPQPKLSDHLFQCGERLGLNIFQLKQGCTNLVKHDIELESVKIIYAQPYKMSPRQMGILKIKVEKMLKMEVIELGESDFASLLILVEVHGRETRPCINNPGLNNVTRIKFYLLSNIEQLIEKVSSTK